jgi:ribonucleoside-triphosphate reductase
VRHNKPAGLAIAIGRQAEAKERYLMLLTDEFIGQYAAQKPNWGFPSGPNSLGELTFHRTYARIKDDGTKERWQETVQRVVEGVYELQRRHAKKNGRPWSEAKARRSAEKMYDKIFNFKFLPPGRGLWMMGTDYVLERGSAALNNCGFVTTDWPDDPTMPYTWLMDMSMLGVGVGFDTRGAGQPVYQPDDEDSFLYTIPDTREGWVESVGLLLRSYFEQGSKRVYFSYDCIRPAGAPINGFGGVASGPAPLEKLHKRIRASLDQTEVLTSRVITDIMNQIGACVVAGNVRRSAEIAIADFNDLEFRELKNYENSEMAYRQEWSWVSNNSLYVTQGVDYEQVVDRVASNGEPGFVYVDNIQKYGRMGEEKPDTAIGVNPCAEQPLESFELCTLVETFPHNHETYEEYEETLKYAYLYGKSVTLLETHNDYTNKVMRRNRRIGTSQTGIVQFVHARGESALAAWSDAGYAYIQGLDELYSEWLGVPMSIRTTTIKPSGTVSLLGGATPGVHYPTHRTYIRRIRVGTSDPLLSQLIAAGYPAEPDQYSDNTWVVELPIKGPEVPTEKEATIEEKAFLATMMAKHWSDNAVSVTITFSPDERGKIGKVLRDNEGKWKTVSFLPITETGAYAQMPYEAITEEEYDRRVARLTQVNLSGEGQAALGEEFCTTDKCEINFGEIESIV